MDSPPIAYTTTIPVSRTVSEIHDILARAGAGRIATEYFNGIPSGVTFALDTTTMGARIFELPVNIDAMHRKMIALDNAGKIRNGSKAQRRSRDQAEKVAWRVVKMWLASQLSLLETEMMELEQVLFPYMKVGGFESETIYEVVTANPGAMRELER